MVLLVPKKGPKTKPNRKITTHASLLQGPCGFCREPDVIQADSVGDAKTEYGEVSKWSAPSFQILTEKKGLGALHFRHPCFETYPYVDHQSQDLIFPHHSHSSDKSFHFGWFPKSSKRTILHTVVKTCRCLFWGAILGNQRKWKDIGPSGCNMKRMPTCNAFWKFTSFPKQSSDGLSSFP